MCLVGDEKSFKRAEKLRKKPGFVIRYKAVDKWFDHFDTAYYLASIWFSHHWKPGWNKAWRDRRPEPTDSEKSNHTVNDAIHVSCTKKEVRLWTSEAFDSSRRMIAVKCYNKDCIAISADGQEAAYTKVFLAREEHDNAVRRTTFERRRKRKTK